MRDVALAAGVSPATASRALDPDASAAPRTRDIVRQAAEDLGYAGNSAARSLRTSRTDTIGLLLPDVRNAFFTDLAYAVDKAAAEAGRTVMIGNADEDCHAQDRYLNTLAKHQVDGLLVVPQGGASVTLRKVVAANPTVSIDRDAGLGVPVIASDSAGGMGELVDHIVALGHRRIAIVAGPQSTSTGRERLRAVAVRLSQHGIGLGSEYLVEGDFQLASGIAAAQQLLGLSTPPEAIIAADALMALGVLTVMRRRGVRIGEDVGIAAVDDTPWFEVLDPAVTVVAQDTAQLGEKAVAALLDRIAGEDVDTTPIPTRLVIRRSLGETAPSPSGESPLGSPIDSAPGSLGESPPDAPTDQRNGRATTQPIRLRNPGRTVGESTFTTHNSEETTHG
nr:LacI family DNA-binding transcriptional regulator [Kineosphaera limosa]